MIHDEMKEVCEEATKAGCKITYTRGKANGIYGNWTAVIAFNDPESWRYSRSVDASDLEKLAKIARTALLAMTR